MTTNDLDRDTLLTLFNNIPLNIFMKDMNCRYVAATQVCRQLSGDDADWTIVGKTDLEVQKDPELAKFFYEDDKEIIRTGKGNKYVSEMKFANETYYYEITKIPLKDNNGSMIGILGMVQDVTEATVLRKKLETSLTTDAMTGARSRHFLKQWRESLSENDYPISVIMCDCDNLKIVNDTYGHDIGDQYLKTFADCILENLSTGRECVRFGGDEFLILCKNMTGDSAKTLADTIRSDAGKKVVRDKPVRASFGCCTIMENFDLDKAILLADHAMYDVKKAGKRLPLNHDIRL
mgnify:CR=1 FL=1